MDNKDSIISFISGDAVLMIFAYFRLGGVFGFFEHLFIVASYGIIGGFCGLAGKELFHWFKRKYLNNGN